MTNLACKLKANNGRQFCAWENNGALTTCLHHLRRWLKRVLMHFLLDLPRKGWARDVAVVVSPARQTKKAIASRVKVKASVELAVHGDVH